MRKHRVQLGLGLISIGRTWGARPVPVPGEAEALAFLEGAYELGIRLFDTSPSYGDSEVKLGRFLTGLSREERAQVSVATKFGEHWNSGTGEPFTDHSYDALRRSLERSLDRLGTIDLLQLHRTSPEVLASADLDKAWESALEAGVGRIGVSASDPASAAAALALRYQAIQMPYNASREDMAPALRAAASKDVELLINRPYQAGAKLYETASPDKCELFAHVLRVRFHGWVLTGTRSVDHLKENLDAFRAALKMSEES